MYYYLTDWIFMQIAIAKCKIAQNAHDIKKYIKYPEHNAFCTTW